MKRRKLSNYLRMYRKRAGFTQREISFLLGARTAGKVSRYERFNRQPDLDTAFALEAIFEIPASELFAGVREQAARDVRCRAKKLARHLNDGNQTQQKVTHLEALAGRKEPDVRYEPIPRT